MYQIEFVPEVTDDSDHNYQRDGFQIAKNVKISGGLVPKEFESKRFLWNKSWISDDGETFCLVVPSTNLLKEGFRLWRVDNRAKTFNISPAFQGRYRRYKEENGKALVVREVFDQEKKRHFEFEETISWMSSEDAFEEERKNA